MRSRSSGCTARMTIAVPSRSRSSARKSRGFEASSMPDRTEPRQCRVNYPTPMGLLPHHLRAIPHLRIEKLRWNRYLRRAWALAQAVRQGDAIPPRAATRPREGVTVVTQRARLFAAAALAAGISIQPALAAGGA